MAAALVPQNHLGRMPDELLLAVIKQPCLSMRDLISLARTNRRNYRVVISPAYRAHVERDYGVAIYWAIKNGRQSTLERLVENGVDINFRKKSDGTALDRYELQRALNRLWLLKSSRSIPNPNPQGPEPRLLPMINLFHSNYRPDPAVRANYRPDPAVRVTPLAWAARYGQDSAVKYLLDNGADLELVSQQLCTCSHELLSCALVPGPPYFSSSDDHQVRYPWTPLHYALCNRHSSTARLLLAHGADAGDVGGKVPAFLVATRFGLDDIVDYLMANGLADINAKDCNGVTALHVAHVAGRYDLVAKYLKQGADINASFADPWASFRLFPKPWTIYTIAREEKSYRRRLLYLWRGAKPLTVLQLEAV